jgi:hypothetical protein
MAELELEHMAWESDLLAHISDLDSRALSYEERIDGFVSANTELHEAWKSCIHLNPWYGDKSFWQHLPYSFAIFPMLVLREKTTFLCSRTFALFTYTHFA